MEKEFTYRRINAELGFFESTRMSGDFWQYHSAEAVGHIDNFAEDAIRYFPAKASVCWFWFNGTIAPISPLDRKEELIERWSRWRKLFQSEPPALEAEERRLVRS